MKVKALKNLIYDGTFHKANEVFSMPEDDAADYETRHWVIRPLQTSTNTAKAPELPATIVNELPPLNDIVRKKK